MKNPIRLKKNCHKRILYLKKFLSTLLQEKLGLTSGIRYSRQYIQNDQAVPEFYCIDFFVLEIDFYGFYYIFQLLNLPFKFLNTLLGFFYFFTRSLVLVLPPIQENVLSQCINNRQDISIDNFFKLFTLKVYLLIQFTAKLLTNAQITIKAFQVCKFDVYFFVTRSNKCMKNYQDIISFLIFFGQKFQVVIDTLFTNLICNKAFKHQSRNEFINYLLINLQYKGIFLQPTIMYICLDYFKIFINIATLLLWQFL
eukprot:TRINITY_DN107635_c0_g1_i1.p1 TRINITY_DN107635_c0_g1~~TRINITY_DN107635_c0_g1_i1.p1  ORF type:complete len:254 (-),score=-11.23 TRINITY_DN107635_c0_g1_i1:134-895(-)